MYIGMDRFAVKKQIAVDLDNAGLLEKMEDYTNKVGYSERNPDTVIEPKLSMQWFLKMQHFADMALPPVMNDELKFYPPKYKNTYRNWLENIKDWCISRQLWWGHRIPAYFMPKGGFVVAETIEKAVDETFEDGRRHVRQEFKRLENATHKPHKTKQHNKTKNMCNKENSLFVNYMVDCIKEKLK